MGATVLVVEDEVKLRDLIRAFLERDGLTVFSTGVGAQAIEIGSQLRPDLVVLDLGLPDVPGDVVAQELRRVSDVPILMLTAKCREEDRIRGLELGADDYLTKPFSVRELVLRVNAILRRSKTGSMEVEATSFGGGQLVIDDARHQALLNGEPLTLSPTEWCILCTLARVPGRVYTRYELLNAARGYEADSYERVVDTHIKNLRHKLHDDPPNRNIIETVLGAGYRLCLERDF